MLILNRCVIRIGVSYVAFARHIDIARIVDSNGLGVIKEVARAIITHHPLLLAV